jgi:hypothetical protein
MCRPAEKSRTGAGSPVHPDSLLAQIIERHVHLFSDVAMCTGILVVVSVLVVTAHSVVDAL